MGYLVNNEQKINDIVFANRNKKYGAYAIRSNYGNTMLKSIAIMSLGFTSIMGSAFYYTHRNNSEDRFTETIPIQDSVLTTVFDMEKNKEQKKVNTVEQPKTKQKTSTEIATPNRIADSNLVTTSTLAITFTNSGATTSSVISDVGITSGTGTNSASVSNSASIANGSEEPYENFGVDSNPEFEGGLKALYKFVASKLKYPVIASNEGIEGTVYVKFVVDENGKVGNLLLSNTVGYGLDEEALRVVSLIPNFKSPAKVKGKPVKVYYQLPIKYKLQH